MKICKKVIPLLLLLCLAACGTESGSASPSPTAPETPAATQTPAPLYENPVFDESFADPVIYRDDDGTIYAYGTPDSWDSDGAFHICPILTSTNLVDWSYAGDVFDAVPRWNGGEAIWATELIRIGDLYCLYYTLIGVQERPAIGVAVAEHPAGPFTDKGYVIAQKDTRIYCIDPFVTYDEAGVLWLIYGNYDEGVFRVELSADGLDFVGEPIPFAAPFEGVYLLQREGYYYLFGSLGSVWEGENSSYHVCVARSESLFGPYTLPSGALLDEAGREELVILASGSGERFFAGPGNNSVILDDAGTYWMLYHAVDSRKPYMANGGTRRPLCIDPLGWDDEGWPYIEGGVPSLTGTQNPVFITKDSPS